MYKGKGVKVGDTAVLSQDVIIGQGSSVGADVVLNAGLVTNSISIDSVVLHGGQAGPSQFSEQQEQMHSQQMHNQGLRQLLSIVSWEIRA